MTKRTASSLIDQLQSEVRVVQAEGVDFSHGTAAVGQHAFLHACFIAVEYSGAGESWASNV